MLLWPNSYRNSIQKKTPRTATAGPEPVRVESQRPKAPPSGHAKIHVDAAVRPGKGGLASAVCRENDGNNLGSSSLILVLGVCDPVVLEAMACREECCYAHDTLGRFLDDSANQTIYIKD